MATNSLAKPPSRVRNCLKVKINKPIDDSEISAFAKYIADEVFRLMPKDRDAEAEIKVSLDYSEMRTISKETRKMIMDHLEEELLRCE